MSLNEIQEEIVNLKNSQDVTILAHYYQPLEIQEISDHLGDSLGLSRLATKVSTKYIIFAGVLFMAETASILNQDKHILIPSTNACCPLANFLNESIVKEYRKEYQEYPIVTYVNTTAFVKAESDICSTSSNAVKIIEKIAEEFKVDTVLFGPDKNLAEYTEENTHINIIKIPGKGHCYVHSYVTQQEVEEKKREFPIAKILAHPECNSDVRKLADYIGSTAGMYNYVKENPEKAENFIISTEKGLLERLETDFPNYDFILASDNLLCQDMKKNSLQKIKYLLNNLNDHTHEVTISPEVAKRAYKPIEKMLKFSK